MPSNHLILCCPLLQPSIFPSIRVFYSESVLCIRWPKYWSFSFSISPFSEHSGLISFRMHWLDFLGLQGTLKSLLQHRSSKASILRCSTFFIVQLSHLYMTSGKTIALTRWTFIGKVMSLLFNMLSRLVIAFLPRSKRLLISWLQSCLKHIKLYFQSGSLQMPEMLCPCLFAWLILTDPSGPRLNLFIHQENFPWYLIPGNHLRENLFNLCLLHLTASTMKVRITPGSFTSVSLGCQVHMKMFNMYLRKENNISFHLWWSIKGFLCVDKEWSWFRGRWNQKKGM